MTRQELDSYLAGIRSRRTERLNLRTQLADLTTLRERLEARLAVQVWAELDSGESIAVGTQVRHIGRIYECTVAHNKALLRSPINTQYWREVDG